MNQSDQQRREEVMRKNERDMKYTIEAHLVAHNEYIAETSAVLKGHAAVVGAVKSDPAMAMAVTERLLVAEAFDNNVYALLRAVSRLLSEGCDLYARHFSLASLPLQGLVRGIGHYANGSYGNCAPPTNWSFLRPPSCYDSWESLVACIKEEVPCGHTDWEVLRALDAYQHAVDIMRSGAAPKANPIYQDAVSAYLRALLPLYGVRSRSSENVAVLLNTLLESIGLVDNTPKPGDSGAPIVGYRVVP